MAHLKDSKRRTLAALRQQMPDLRVYNPMSLNPQDQARLIEKGLLPASFEKLTQAALAADEGESLSVAINTAEHVLIQARDRAGRLHSLINRVRETEEALASTQHPFAYDSRFGYLSFNPVLAGSGLYLSLVMHLPMLNFLKQIKSLGEPLKQRFGCQIKPHGTYSGRNPGNLFVLSNAASFEREDEDIVYGLTQAADLIAGKETILREKAFLHTRVTPLADQAWRAYGTLRYARRLTSSDFLSLWSKVRLGALAGILPVSVVTTDQMLDFRGDSRYLTNGAEQKTCPFRRADEVRQALSGGEHANIRTV